jgi:hypothetical protein
MVVLHLLACRTAIEPPPSVPPAAAAPSAVGVLMRVGDELRAVFPAQEPVAEGVTGELVVFDALGTLARVPVPALERKMWCENDGGEQFRLEGVVPEIPVAPRQLETLADADGIVAFVWLGPSGAVLPPADPEQSVRWLGDLEGDGKPEAAVVGWPDEAMCEDGNLALRTARGTAPLRCCGP